MSDKAKHLTLAELNAVLPKSTAEKFEIVNMNKRTSTKFFHAKHGTIDLNTLTVAHAERLVNQKADFIQVKTKEKTTKA